MPICKRDGFDNVHSKSKDATFHDNESVFFCEVTKEIFRDYEDYFRHVMVINSTVWQCEATGRDNLTYAEALKSERRARKKMELFKDCLRPPVMLVIEHAKQSSLNALSALVFRFLRKRFFRNEKVSATQKSGGQAAFTVVDIVWPNKTLPANGVYEETDKLHYKLRSVQNAQMAEITVPFQKVRRQRFELTSENLQMFIKSNVMRVDGLLIPKPESYKKYVIDRKISFEGIFIGKMPYFTPARIKRPPEDNSRKQLTLNKYLVKNGVDEKQRAKTNGVEQVRRDKEKAEKAERMEAKARSLKEEMERVRREKQEEILRQERLKAEKRAKLLEKIEEECTELLTKTDDLERIDQRLLPNYTPVETYLSTKLLGDAFMLREFMHSFVGILSGIEVFRGNVNFYEMSRAFTIREVAGPLSDMIIIFLRTIFDLQREEEEECPVVYTTAMQFSEPFRTMAMAARTFLHTTRHFSLKLNELPLDAFTISEVLRLHLLSSGASISNKKAEKWRVMYRNGYTSSGDPGLTLRIEHPHILQTLKLYTVYQLPFMDIMRIMRCLMSQILSYSSPINLIEERMEQMMNTRTELRTLANLENQRLSKVQSQKRALRNEFNQQCMEESVKNDQEKRRVLEEKLNKKVAELMAQSERERKKYEQQVGALNGALFSFLVYLGMDRAYRKYYVLESMPGIFVEHPADCMDTCLKDPPKNSPASCLLAKTVNLPKNRRDLRAYLLRMYTEEEKKANDAANLKKNKKENEVVAQENKENQENGQLIGLSNGYASGSSELDEGAGGDVSGQSEHQPTQYQLYMCTGDPRNCIVHDENNRDRHRWAYLYKKEELDALLESLNPLGIRESELRDNLTILRVLIEEHIKKCPFKQLSVEKSKLKNFKTIMLAETYRKYSNSNMGFPEGADLNEVMYGALVERILQFENEIYTGDLGRLKVKNMEKWRNDLQNGTYDPQGKLQWGPKKQTLIINSKVNGENEAKAEGDGDGDGGVDECEIEPDAEREDSNMYFGKPFSDPGDGLGESLEIDSKIDSEDSADEGISLHDSETLRTHVRQLASALLQVEQAVERRFLKEPFGVPTTKDKELLERKLKWSTERLRQWELSLMESTSYSQVFLHLNVLYDCILWARSTRKSNCMVCRRGSDPEKMLLCDECNGGTHMFCMKPKMKTVPEGNWYCKRCVDRLGLENESDKNNKKTTQKRKTTFLIEDDNSDVSSVISDSKSNGRRLGGRRASRRLQSTEIEKVLEEEGEDVDVEDGTLDDISEVNEHDDDDNDDGDDDDDDDVEQSETNDDTEADEEESVCVVCSYDGSELSCIRCKSSFHLECIRLKRPPRYNFICDKCKSREDTRKRKSKANDSSSEEEDNDEDVEEPINKRTRLSRHAQRNCVSNGVPESTSSIPKANNHQRRFFRRTGEDLPLDSATLYDLLEKIMKHEYAWPFLRPVSQAEVPDYYQIIKCPMDFAKVKSKLNMGSYQINEEVMKDIELIFSNCDEYNVKGNEIYQAGATLEQFVIECCKELNLPFKPSDMSLDK